MIDQQDPQQEDLEEEQPEVLGEARPVDAADLLLIYDSMAHYSKGAKRTAEQLSNSELSIAVSVDQHFHNMETLIGVTVSPDTQSSTVPRGYLALARAVVFSVILSGLQADRRVRFWRTGAIIMTLLFIGSLFI